jgi:hypothetical protein
MGWFPVVQKHVARLSLTSLDADPFSLDTPPLISDIETQLVTSLANGLIHD